MLTALAFPLRNLLAGVIFMLAIMAAVTLAYVHQGWPLGPSPERELDVGYFPT